ncbi:MAG: type I DNA topoisomerase, partial [candidate division WOR-3 bacterium]
MIDKSKKVIIVESPTKSKTIKGFVGRGYTVISSKGHIKDLPKSMLGVDVDNNFEPRYIKIRGKAKIVQDIKKACKNSSVIFLAPDPDREGEAIAQHLAEELNSTAPSIKRTLFYEITPEHVKDALQNPSEINTNLVSAHKARRVLDRIVGYYTSPILWSILKGGLSAGRVQSVALRLICEKEREIKSFISTPYWTADAEFETERGEKFKGTLWRIDGEYRKIANIEELIRFQGLLKKGANFTVISFRITNPQRMPPPPFITSTLEQEAARRHNFPARKTMQIAQSLYEGVRLPEGRIGLITYMRTDSIRVNASALEGLRNFIAGKYGQEYLNKEIRVFKDRKRSQGGHEAIRPTKIRMEPESIKDYLTPEQFKIYTLIYNRFVASQMAPARYRMKEAIVNFMGVDFRAEEFKPKFLGYQLVSGDVIERGYVPKLRVGEIVQMSGVEFTEKQTEPPPRYTEASLIKKLEENGIGRPSTYAIIVQRLFDRRYVIRENSKIVPTELGMQVYDIIIPRFSNI